MRVMNSLDFGGARAAGRFSSKGDPKNSSGAKPFSHAGAAAAASLESMVAAKFAALNQIVTIIGARVNQRAKDDSADPSRYWRATLAAILLSCHSR